MKPIYLPIFALTYSAFYYLFVNEIIRAGFRVPTNLLIFITVLSIAGLIGSVLSIVHVHRIGASKRHLAFPIYYIVRLALTVLIMAIGYPSSFAAVEWTYTELMLRETELVLRYATILLEPVWAVAILVWSWRRH